LPHTQKSGPKSARSAAPLTMTQAGIVAQRRRGAHSIQI
jgi:hypothetical protein